MHSYSTPTAVHKTFRAGPSGKSAAMIPGSFALIILVERLRQQQAAGTVRVALSNHSATTAGTLYPGPFTSSQGHRYFTTRTIDLA